MTERLKQPIVLVGLMGAGKTALGRRLAARLGVAFYDSDEVIIEKMGLSIADIFTQFGEAEFRSIERQTVAGLLENPDCIIALGGGAFIDDATRKLVKEHATSLWIDAELDILVERTGRKPGKRPLLSQGDPEKILKNLMIKRYPIYQLADIRIKSDDLPFEVMLERITATLNQADVLS